MQLQEGYHSASGPSFHPEFTCPSREVQIEEAPCLTTMGDPVKNKTTRRRNLEILAVLATAGGHLACHVLPIPRLLFVSVVVIGWVLYGATRGGLSNPNFAAAWRPLALFGGVSIAIMAAIGLFMGTFSLHWHLFAALLLYPLWGVVQQYLVQELIAGNLDESGWGLPAITLATAALFGLIHLPFAVLMVATFVLGLVFTPHYLRYRNVLVLGLWHGWLGTLLYFWVLGRDPLSGLG